MHLLLPRPNETLNFYYLSKLHSRSRKQTYLVVMLDSRSLFLLARYYPNSTGTIPHTGQVKNPHRLPISKTSLVNLFPGVCSPMARCCDCPYYHRSRKVSRRWPELQGRFTRRSTGRSNLLG
ncbi:hypothetical protein CDAR_281651 [Caerostris darwini]|uniref:Uncharacterized protein n=1 Tax=Caerostris darwini TaxID=1538125 RepID=A0AAV4Q2S3_9ARAC|nr:hypothetical protein CDAR_281651 [Caerostris darwini]